MFVPGISTLDPEESARATVRRGGTELWSSKVGDGFQ